MEEAGQRLKRVRERLDLTLRDVEEASILVAERNQNNNEFIINISRLHDIENKGTLPNIYRLYSLCCIYKLDPADVQEWYGVPLANLASDAAAVTLKRTNLLDFTANGHGDIQVPLALEPGLDLRKTTFLSRMIQRWGKLPLALLNGLEVKSHRYAFVGTDDWFMYPIIPPGSLVAIDETLRKIVNTGWGHEYERPIYFLETRNGYAFGWCTLNESQLVLQPHPASGCLPAVYAYPSDVDSIGQIYGVAKTILDRAKKPRTRA